MSARRRRLSLQRVSQRRQRRANRRAQQRLREYVTPRRDGFIGYDLASGPDHSATIVFLSGEPQPLQGLGANDRRFWVVRP